MRHARWLFLLSVVLALSSWAQGARDRTPPSLTLTEITLPATTQAAGTAVTLHGTAQDDTRVTQVTCRTPPGLSGVVTGTTNWTCQLTLPIGETDVTVTATDGAGRSTSLTFTVTLEAPASATPDPRPITVQWSWSGAAVDAFRLERCTKGQGACPNGGMTFLESVDATARQWVDRTVLSSADYCYRLNTVTGQTRGPYSNTLCSP